MRDEAADDERPADPDAITLSHGFARTEVASGSARILPLNAITPLGATLDGLVGDSVDVINNLVQGALLRFLPGVAPGPRTRTYGTTPLPDPGTGNLALPALGAVPGKGTITPVNNAGQPVASGATGVTLAGGAYLASLDPISPTLSLSGGWALSFSYRVPTGAKNSSKAWASVGKRVVTNYGITVTETASGALVATIEDPRFTAVHAQSVAVSRDTMHTARLVWSSTSQLLQWLIDGVQSGSAVTLGFVPEVGNGAVLLGSNLSLTPNSPIGALYGFVFESTGADQTNSYFPVGPSSTLSASDASTLQVDTTGVLVPVAAAGDVSFSYATATGSGSQDLTVSYAGYVAPTQTLTSYLPGEMPYCPVDLGSADANGSVLILTPPTHGKIRTGSSTDFYGVGALAPVVGDGIPQRNFLNFQPIAGGTHPGQNPGGSTTRGSSDFIRTQQGSVVRVTNVIEMNRASRLNGGGEAWGHADDVWLPIHALSFGYDSSSFTYPTLDGEVPVITVTQVPAGGEGSVRLLRTGTDLRVGNTVPHDSVKYLGWYKPGVASVSAGCMLQLTVTTPGAPTGVENYALKMTDATRPTALGWWEQANALFSDQHTHIRWANRGGDWLGLDGVWGAQPFVTAPVVSKPGAVTLDVTAMVAAGGPNFFIALAGGGTLSVVPGFYTPDPIKEPTLRVTGGTNAGIYRATRCAAIANSDTGSWLPANTSAFGVRQGQTLLLAYDSAGDCSGATKIELLLNIVTVYAGGGALQLFRPSPQPPRPGPRVSVGPTPTLQRSDLVCKVDSNDDWYAMLNGTDPRNASAAGQPTNYTIANGCYYGGIVPGANGGLSLLRGFFKADGTGYPVVRMGRMVGWHLNYQPGDANVGVIGLSGKSPGIAATGSGSLSNLTSGFGGRTVSGYSGYTMRMQRGSGGGASHPSTSPLSPYLAFGDYDYFLSGNTNGLTTFAINPLPRMAWVWIESVHAVNSIYADGTWANDGMFELYVNGRKQCESRRLEWRVAGNGWLWDMVWFDEYNGGTVGAQPDRLWPFVVGPTYVVAGTDPIAPPPGWNVPFVTAAGVPDTVPLVYKPDW